MNINNKLKSISASNQALDFLSKRLKTTDYRGIHLSEHNRYTISDIIILLETMKKIVGDSRLTIRNTDLSKRPKNNDDEKLYDKYVNSVSRKINRGTQDSVRKLFFVDMARMGLINRFDKKQVMTDPFKKSRTKYVEISGFGFEFLKSKNNVFKKQVMFAKCVDNLTQGFGDDLVGIIGSLNNCSISIFEYMFFATFVGRAIKTKRYTQADVIELIKDFRRLSRFQKDAVVNAVQEYCNPNSFSGNKKNKRDFSNWKNEAQQTFKVLGQTPLFEADSKNSNIKIKVGKGYIYSDKKKLKRSKIEKDKYYAKHKVAKKPGFELHHIIPLFMAENAAQYSVLDVWQNMIYIDGQTHGVITHQGSKNIKLVFSSNNVIFESIGNIKPVVEAVKNINVFYSSSKKSIMKRFNAQTLNSF